MVLEDSVLIDLVVKDSVHDLIVVDYDLVVDDSMVPMVDDSLV